MATLPKAKLEQLRRYFVERAMSPGQAAKKVGIAYATANRYYSKWSQEIERGIAQQLVPQMKESIEKFARKRKSKK